jgi:hypothetical protein
VFSASGDINAPGKLTTTASVTFTTAADINAPGKLSAAGAVAFTTSADVSATGKLSCTSSVTFSTSADVSAIGRLATTSSIAFTTAADLSSAEDNDNLTATAIIVFSPAADVSAPGRLAATAQITLSTGAFTAGNAVAAGPEEFTTLTEFALEANGEELLRIYKSFEGLRTPEIDYEQGLLNAGRVVRSIGPGSEPYSVGAWECEEYNLDGQYSILKYSYRFRGRKRYLRFARIADGLAQARQLFVGSLEDWNIDSRGRVTFQHKDAGIDRFKKTLRETIGSVNPITFPDLPSGQAETLINVIYGDMATNGGNMPGAGPIPCTLIDADAGGKWRYLVAGHVCKQVHTVYKYGVVQSSGFTVTTAIYTGITMQVIDFDADPRDADRPNEVEVTVLAKGITDDGTSGGTLIENLVEQAQHFILNYGGSWVSGDFDAALWTASVDAADANMLEGVSAPYKGAWCITGDINQRVLDILNEITKSHLHYIWMTTENKIGSFLLTLSIAANPGAPAFEVSEREIVRNSFNVYGNRDVWSSIDYQRIFNYTLEKFAVTSNGSASIPVQRTFPIEHISRTFPLPHTSRTFGLAYDAGGTATLELGDEDTPDAPGKVVPLKYVADEDTAISIATVNAMLASEHVQFCEFELPAEYLLNAAADLNRYVGVTHRQGISSTGGYSNAVFRIIKTEAEVMPKKKGLRLTLIKLSA